MRPHLRTGPVSYEIKSSKGADNYPLSFYSSTYSSQHGVEEFKPRTTRHYGTGYISNYRPGVYYCSSLDDYDNVPVGKLLRDNYVSSFTKQFRPYHDSDGKDPFPLSVIKRKSGFTQAPPVGAVPFKKVYGARSMLIDDGERYKPRLHKIQLKPVPQIDEGTLNPISEEKFCFKGKPWEKLNIHQKDVGKNEPSGFTHCHHFDPIQCLPRDAYAEDSICWRPTENTICERKYLRWPTMSGKEMNEGVTKNSNRYGGFTHDNGLPHYLSRIQDDAFTKVSQIDPVKVAWTKKNDPAESENLHRASEKKSMLKSGFQGKQFPYVQKQYDGIGKRKELSGYSIHHLPYNPSKSTEDNFNTQYEDRICYVPKFERHINRMDTDKLPDGFTNSTKIHNLGDKKRFREARLEQMTPLVARRIKNEEPYLTSRTMNYKWKKAYDLNEK